MKPYYTCSNKNIPVFTCIYEQNPAITENKLKQKILTCYCEYAYFNLKSACSDFSEGNHMFCSKYNYHLCFLNTVV